MPRIGPARRTRIPLVKAHAYGNDFLIAPEGIPGDLRAPDFAREVCDRHRGLGADGLMLVEVAAEGVRMVLLNADGSPSEVSGNGVRCVAAWRALTDQAANGEVTVLTDAGPKRVTIISRAGRRVTALTDMGAPEHLRQVDLDASGEMVRAVLLRVGNPQCVVLGLATADRLGRLGRSLATHAAFPEGTNVELAEVIRPDLVRILIWERGVGPTTSSGTGACAAAVAAAAYGGASRSLSVEAPGGSQHVEWTEDNEIRLTGWAEIVADAEWWLV